MPRTTRRSLRTLQQTATDTENLVGRPSKGTKHQLSQENPVDVEVKRKNVSKEKDSQVNLDNEITVDDLTNPEGASNKYWQILAEKRQIALEESLEENIKLRKIIEDLKQENILFKQMLEEANSFVEVIKEELANNCSNDTGIDVNDVSTVDDVSRVDDVSTNEDVSTIDDVSAVDDVLADKNDEIEGTTNLETSKN